MSIKNAEVAQTYKNADVSSITKAVNGKLSKEDVKRLMNSWRDRDAELVTGIFKNNEEPGQSTSFRFKAYPGDDFKEWFFEDGEKYQIPRGIARHLNTACYTKEYKHLPSEAGTFGIRAAVKDGSPARNEQLMSERKVYRYSFLSLEFQEDDLDMQPSKLFQISKSPMQV
jgi:hypothetical protein